MSSAHFVLPAVEPARPTVRAAAPFVGVAFLGIVSVFLPPFHHPGEQPILMVVLFAACLGLLAVSIRRTTRTWIDPVPPALFFLVLALARDATGGSASNLGPLVVLPILWLAMTGTRRDLVLASVLTAAMFLMPLYFLGAPNYQVGDWRRALVWTAFAAFVAPAIQRMVRRLAVETRSARATAIELDSIMRGARLSSMISTDVGGTIRTFSLGSEELLGYSAAEVVGRRDPGLFHDLDEVAEVAAELGVEPGFAVFAELARLRAPSRIWTYVCADGRRIFVGLAITDLRDTEGVVYGYLGVAIDATAAIEASEALAMAEARWRVLMDHLPDVTVVMVDESQTIRVVGGAGSMRQGFHDSVGKKLSDISKPENMVILDALLEEGFAGREASGVLHSTATGAEHEVAVTPLPPDHDGARALIFARDVSVQRDRERAVIRARDRAERLFADAPHGVAVLSADGTVLQMNSAMRNMVGEMTDGSKTRKLSDFAWADDARFDRHLADTLAVRGSLAESDWTMRNVDGHAVQVTLSSRVLGGLDGSRDVVLVNVVDVSERFRYEQQLTYLADHDPLTGLANRRRFDDVLAKHMDHCARYGPGGALLLLDLDNFKEVNDTLGHGAGDELIISVAGLLKSGIRSTDVVARLGGDEFAVLLPNSDQKAAESVAASIVERVRHYTATLDGTRRRVTASVGVVTVKAAQEQDAGLLALADMTMYDAKEAGRNGYAVLDGLDCVRPRSGTRLHWKGRIEQAIENDDFALHLQPILDMKTDEIHSAEVLLRLDDSDELILPCQFLPVAERAGLGPAVDLWVIRHSVEMLARLRLVDPEFELEVNLSGLSIGNPAIERVIVESLEEFGVEPSALILEITETAAVTDVELARQFAERMTALGCKFALDDFGAGFGSFYYLKHLLFDYVKIDGEFVANCHRSSVDRTILHSIIGIAHDLGKKTVAEFVADPEILEIVRAENVDLAQGYLIGRPCSYDDFVDRFMDSEPALSTSHPNFF